MNKVKTISKYVSPQQIARIAECDEKIVTPYFEACYLARFTYMDKGEQKPIVRLIRQEGKFNFALSKHPEALKTFFDYCIEKSAYFILPQKKEGMLSSTDLQKIYGKTHYLYKELIDTAYSCNATFIQNGRKKRLIIPVRAPYAPTLVLREGKEALNAFIQFAQERGIEFPSVRPVKEKNHLSAKDLKIKYNLNINQIESIMKTCYQEKIKFQVENQFFDLVQQVRVSNYSLLVLNSHPKALDTFISHLEKNGISVEKEKITTQKQSTLINQITSQNERSS